MNLLLTVAVLVIAVFLLIKFLKKRKNEEADNKLQVDDKRKMESTCKFRAL